MGGLIARSGGGYLPVCNQTGAAMVPPALPADRRLACGRWGAFAGELARPADFRQARGQAPLSCEHDLCGYVSN